MRRPATALVPALVLTLLASLALVAAPVGASARGPVAVPDTLPGWLGNAVKLGAAAAPVDARVYLAPRGGIAALERVATAMSTPTSASYGEFLSPAQYQARYAPSATTVARVTSWLTHAGLAVTAVAPDNQYLSVHGAVTAANRAFGTRITRFRHDGITVQAPSRALTVPFTLASSVLTITGMDTTPDRMTPRNSGASALATYPDGFRNSGPCSLYFGEKTATYAADGKTRLPLFHGKALPYAPCGYFGPKLRKAYEGTTSLNGSGVTVAVVGAYTSPSIASDVNTYATHRSDGAYVAGQFTQAAHGTFTHGAQNDCDQLGWYGEQALDIEAVHAMAPGAKIRYYPANSCLDADFLDALTRVVDENSASIVTNSWGGIETFTTRAAAAAYHAVFVRGVAQGQSFLFSSGDGGDEFTTTGRRSVNFPAADSYVTAVGGTSTAVSTTGALAFQTGWGTTMYSLAPDGTAFLSEGFLYGSGGGSSTRTGKPSYQQFIAPGLTRQVPDVAMDGDPNTGFIVGLTQRFPTGNAYAEYRIGGTSLSSPLFAGMTALTVQHAHKRGGLLNIVLYKKRATLITDVQGAAPVLGVVRVDFRNSLDSSKGLAYSIRTFNEDSTLAVKAGWDPVTGLGTPNGAWLSGLG